MLCFNVSITCVFFESFQLVSFAYCLLNSCLVFAYKSCRIQEICLSALIRDIFHITIPSTHCCLCRADKGQSLKASYIHYVDRPDGFTVAAEINHRLSTLENRFTIGSSQSVDPNTVLKTRFSDDGKAAFQCQRAWRPNSLITLSAEYDSTKIFSSSTKLGLALSLKP